MEIREGDDRTNFCAGSLSPIGGHDLSKSLVTRAVSSWKETNTPNGQYNTNREEGGKKKKLPGKKKRVRITATDVDASQQHQ